jgi:GMP reductase
MQNITREYNYSDVYLIPNKCVVESRRECSTSTVIGGKVFDLPVCPANMPAVINEDTCEFLARKNIFYVMHRFDMDQIKFIDKMHSQNLFSSISVGVNDESYKQIKDIKESNLKPFAITVDVAHAWAPKVERMVKFIKDTLPDSFLIVGNIASGSAVCAVESWGADCTKIFIGPGLACTTRICTGHTRPTISCLLECASHASKPVIADGGVREIGDVCKALACGATMVMIGSLFSGFDESGTQIIEIEGHKKAVYFGNASEHAKNGKKSHVEGRKVIMDYKGGMEDFLIEVKESIQSGISYAGGRDISAFMNSQIVAIN